MKGNQRAPFSFAFLSTLHNKQTWDEFQPNSSSSLKQGIELCNSYTGDCTQAWPGVRFLKVPKHFGWHKSLFIFNTKTFPALKLGSYFTFPYIWNILKEQLFTTGGSYSFKNCFLGPISHRVFWETAHRSQWQSIKFPIYQRFAVLLKVLPVRRCSCLPSFPSHVFDSQ